MVRGVVSRPEAMMNILVVTFAVSYTPETAFIEMELLMVCPGPS